MIYCDDQWTETRDMATHKRTHHTLISCFIIGNLPASVTPKDVYKEMELDKYPSQDIIELDLSVDKRGHSRGYAFVQIPRSCSSRLMKKNGCKINGSEIYICYQEGNSHMFKDKKWVKKYKDGGMASSAIPRPRLIYPYKKTSQLTGTEITSLGPLYDMLAELTHRKFASDLDKVMAHCFKNGIGSVVIPGLCCKQREDAKELINQYNSLSMDVYLSTGISPQHACEFSDAEKCKLETEVKLSCCLCMGPTGLDYRLTNVTKEQQMLAFKEQLNLACDKKKSLYFVVHGAHEDFISTVNKYEEKLPKCAIVDFSGNLEELKTYISLGFYIVISGSLNDTRSFIPEVITTALKNKLIPMEKILLASNSPRKSGVEDNMGHCYIPYRSYDKRPLNMKRTEPLCVFLTLETVAKYLGYESLEKIKELGNITVKNSKTFLGFAREKEKPKDKLSLKPGSHQVAMRVNVLFVVFALLAVFLGFLLEYFSGTPEFQAHYLSRQSLF